MKLNSSRQVGGFDHRMEEAIGASPYLAKRKVHVEFGDGQVTLVGTVPSYFQKQMAQETIRRITGVEQIENQLEVVYPVA